MIKPSDVKHIVELLRGKLHFEQTLDNINPVDFPGFSAQISSYIAHNTNVQCIIQNTEAAIGVKVYNELLTAYDEICRCLREDYDVDVPVRDFPSGENLAMSTTMSMDIRGGGKVTQAQIGPKDDLGLVLDDHIYADDFSYMEAQPVGDEFDDEIPF